MVGSVNLPQEEMRETERRKAHLVTAAAYFPDRRETEAHGNASRRSVTAVSVPGTVLPSAGLQADFPPFLCLVQPLKAETRNGPGRYPKASRVRGARPPRPQAPLPPRATKRPR